MGAWMSSLKASGQAANTNNLSRSIDAFLATVNTGSNLAKNANSYANSLSGSNTGKNLAKHVALYKLRVSQGTAAAAVTAAAATKPSIGNRLRAFKGRFTGPAAPAAPPSETQAANAINALRKEVENANALLANKLAAAVTNDNKAQLKAYLNTIQSEGNYPPGRNVNRNIKVAANTPNLAANKKALLNQVKTKRNANKVSTKMANNTLTKNNIGTMSPNGRRELRKRLMRAKANQGLNAPEKAAQKEFLNALNAAIRNNAKAAGPAPVEGPAPAPKPTVGNRLRGFRSTLGNSASALGTSLKAGTFNKYTAWKKDRNAARNAAAKQRAYKNALLLVNAATPNMAVQLEMNLRAAAAAAGIANNNKNLKNAIARLNVKAGGGAATQNLTNVFAGMSNTNLIASANKANVIANSAKRNALTAALRAKINASQNQTTKNRLGAALTKITA